MARTLGLTYQINYKGPTLDSRFKWWKRGKFLRKKEKMADVQKGKFKIKNAKFTRSRETDKKIVQWHFLTSEEVKLERN